MMGEEAKSVVERQSTASPAAASRLRITDADNALKFFMGSSLDE
jgi:hypothetical protein